MKASANLMGHQLTVPVTAIRREVGLDDLGQRHKTAEQISRRQQIRQKINSQPLAIRWRRKVCWRFRFHFVQTNSARIVSPPTTRSPSWTLIFALIGR